MRIKSRGTMFFLMSCSMGSLCNGNGHKKYAEILDLVTGHVHMAERQHEPSISILVLLAQSATMFKQCLAELDELLQARGDRIERGIALVMMHALTDILGSAEQFWDYQAGELPTT